MHQRKYFNSNFFINEIFSVEKFPNYGKYTLYMYCRINRHAVILRFKELVYYMNN